MSTGSTGERVHATATLVAFAFLGFVAGSLVMYSGVFPSRYLTDAYRGGRALYDQTVYYNDRNPFTANLWARARTGEKGVTIYDPAKAYDGLTLYTSGHAQKTLLISMDGTVVHEWRKPFSAIWDDTAQVREPRPDSFMFLDKAYLYPNGDLLAIYSGVDDTPWGYGLVKMNKDSEVIWKYLKSTHHDLDVADDGRIYTLTHEIRHNEIKDWGHLEAPRLDDFVVVLSPDGRELKRIDVLEALLKSRYALLVNTTSWYSKGDYLHTNAIEVIDREAAEKLPFASEGQVLISMREIATIAVLDPDREEITWALRGPWIGQHDPDILPNGHFLLFDNNGHFGPGGASRIIEFDPTTLEIVWSYAGSADKPFESVLRSAQQRLPNGNTLITESDGGRLFEVTPEGEIAWEYVNPERGGEGDAFIPVVSSGQRIDPASLEPGFLGPLPETH